MTNDKPPTPGPEPNIQKQAVAAQSDVIPEVTCTSLSGLKGNAECPTSSGSTWCCERCGGQMLSLNAVKHQMSPTLGHRGRWHPETWCSSTWSLTAHQQSFIIAFIFLRKWHRTALRHELFFYDLRRCLSSRSTFAFLMLSFSVNYATSPKFIYYTFRNYGFVLFFLLLDLFTCKYQMLKAGVSHHLFI